MVESSKCTGCSACLSICPSKCISMEIDPNGFQYPLINKAACIDCKLCEKVCPINRIHNEKINIIPESYLCWARDKEICKHSTSGGFATAVSLSLASSGWLVCGVAYDNSLRAYHVLTNDPNIISLFSKSKYIQSDLNDCYVEINKALTIGKKVLFIGTACQVYGLVSYLQLKKISCDNLITMDIVCHGVPTPKLLTEFVKYVERTSGKSVVSVTMREKSRKWNLYDGVKTVAQLDDGSVYTEDSGNGVFGRLFLSGIANRICCSDCQFKTIGRLSDITIGDCWFSQVITGNNNISKDVTLCICHSLKGKQLIKMQSIEHIKIDTIKAIKCNGGMLYSSCPQDSRSDSFFKELGITPLDMLANHYIAPKPNNPIKSIIKRIAYAIPGVYDYIYRRNRKAEYKKRMSRTLPENKMTITEI